MSEEALGNVVGSRPQAGLAGRRLLVLRAPHQAEETARAISARGAIPILAPAIAISEPSDRRDLLDAARRLTDYDWVLFTSPNGVDRFIEALNEVGQSPQELADRNVGVIGPGTGDALERHGLRATLMAAPYTGEGLARTLLARARPSRVLIPRARVAGEALPEILEQAGVGVSVVIAYETQALSTERRAALVSAFEHGLDAVLLTSSSTAVALVEFLQQAALDLPSKVTLGAIGPVTRATAERLGLRVDVVAAEHTVQGLLDALQGYFERQFVMGTDGAS